MIKLIFLMLLMSFQFALAQDQDVSIPPEAMPYLEGLPENCQAGECIDALIEEYEGIQELAITEGCMPGNSEELTDEELNQFYEQVALNEDCIHKLQRLNAIAEDIDSIATILESADAGLQTACREFVDANGNPLDPDIAAVADETENMCTEDRKAEVQANYYSDLNCAVGSTLLGITTLGVGNIIAGFVQDEDAECNLRDDSCLTQIATGFVNVVWDFLKFILSPIKNAIVSGWNRLWGVEEETSNRQLGLAELSEEPGLLDQFLDEPIESIKKMGAAMMEMLKEWLKNDAFCQEWSGAAHYSECLRPYEGLGCTSLKALINGSCHVAGAFLSEVVPAFLTGGLFNAVKYGASAGKMLVQGLRVSDRLSGLARNSQMAQRIAQTGRRAAQTTRDLAQAAMRTRGMQSAAQFVRNRLDNIGRFMRAAGRLKDARVFNFLKSKEAFIVYDGAKRMVAFTGNALLTGGKIVIYPIENPLTRKAFDMGMNLGRAGIVSGGIRVGLQGADALTAMDNIDEALVEFSRAEQRMGQLSQRQANGRVKNQDQFNSALEQFSQQRENYIRVLRENRSAVFNDVISSPNITLDDIIQDVFPELKYGDNLSTSLSPAEIRRAENQLNSLISRVDDADMRQRLRLEFNDFRATPQRSSRNIDERVFYRQEDVLRNAGLDNSGRMSQAFVELGIDPSSLSSAQRNNIARAVIEAHEVGLDSGASVYNYSRRQLAEKYRILTAAGLENDQARRLVRSGIVGGLRRSDDVLRRNDEFYNGIRAAVREQSEANPERVRQFEEFINVNRDEINRAMRVGDISPDDLNLDNLIILRNRESGRQLVGVRSSAGGDIQVFTPDNARLGFLRGRRADIRSLANREGNIFITDNGQAIKVADDGSIRIIEEGLPENTEAVNRVFDSLYARAGDLSDEMATQYREFLRRHADRLRDDIYNGNVSIDELSPENFRLATVANSNQQFYVLGRMEAGNPIPTVYSATDDTVKLLDDVYDNAYTLHFSDGSALRVDASGGTRHFDTAMTDQVIDDLGILNPNRSDLDSVQREFLTKHGDYFRQELRSHNLTSQDLRAVNLTTYVTDEGDSYFALIRNNMDDSVLFLKEGTGFPTTLREVFDRGSQGGAMANGNRMRRFVIEGREQIVASSYRQNFVQDLLNTRLRESRVAMQSDETLRAYNEFLVNKDGPLQNLLRSSNNSFDLSTSNVFTTKIDNQDFYVVRSSSGDEVVFIPFDDTVYPGGLGAKSNYSAEDIRSIQTEVSLNPITANGDQVRLQLASDGSHQFLDEVERFSINQVIRNSQVDIPSRVTTIQRDLGIQLNQTQIQALDAVINGNTFRNASAFNYSQSQLRSMNRVLRDAGFSGAERRYLIESGLASRPPSLRASGADAFFSDDYSRIMGRNFDNYRDEIRMNLLSRTSSENPLENLADAFRGRSTTFTPEEAQTVLDNVDALYFIDYSHYSNIALDMMDGNARLHKTDIFSRYNSGSERPFENFQNTMRWMSEDRPDVSLDTFRRAHSTMMEGSVEGVSSAQLGSMRSQGVYGNVPKGYEIDNLAVQNINDNIYTTWLGLSRSEDGLNTGRILYPELDSIKPEAIERLRRVNPQLADELTNYKDSQDIIRRLRDEIAGTSNYGNEQAELVATLQARYDELDALPKRTPQQVDEYIGLADRIPREQRKLENFEVVAQNKREKLEAQIRKVQDDLAELPRRRDEVNRELIEGLTEERVRWFNEQRAALGRLDSSEKMDEFVNLAAEFQRDLVSIHPFVNGNGRTTRQFGLNFIMMREGLPPPRILDPNNDIYRSLAEWQDDVRQGVLSSQNLMEDLAFRSRTGLPLENSPDLVAPVDRSRVQLSMWKDGKSNNWSDAPQLEELNASQYREFLGRALEEQPHLRDVIRSNPTEGWREANARAMELYRENNIYYDYRRNGNVRVERLRVGVPDQDFLHMYGRQTYDDLAQFNYKMDEFYSDRTVWRGLAYRNGSSRARTDDEIVEMFREFNTQMSSNRVARQGPQTSDEIRELALRDFEEYRRAVYGDDAAEGDLATITDWHAEAVAPFYGNSIGYSTSANRKVGEDFALGAMQVGEYRKLPGDKVSEYLKPENQARIAQSLLIGEVASNTHHVDMMRLKKLRPDFSYGYFRQAETMGIGATDPDAIRIIQVVGLDDKGKRIVQRSFVRDPDNPALIHIVNGPATEGVRPPAGDIVRTVDMREI